LKELVFNFWFISNCWEPELVSNEDNLLFWAKSVTAILDDKLVRDDVVANEPVIPSIEVSLLFWAKSVIAILCDSEVSDEVVA